MWRDWLQAWEKFRDGWEELRENLIVPVAGTLVLVAALMSVWTDGINRGLQEQLRTIPQELSEEKKRLLVAECIALDVLATAGVKKENQSVEDLRQYLAEDLNRIVGIGWISGRSAPVDCVFPTEYTGGVLVYGRPMFLCLEKEKFVILSRKECLEDARRPGARRASFHA